MTRGRQTTCGDTTTNNGMFQFFNISSNKRIFIFYLGSSTTQKRHCKSERGRQRDNARLQRRGGIRKKKHPGMIVMNNGHGRQTTDGHVDIT
jgi:hypothetical protein